jgi:hypothetical protein
MSAYVTIELDTTAPASPSMQIEGGAANTNSQLVNVTLGTTDGVTTGYSMMIYGNVDLAYDTNIQSDEASSSFFGYSTTKQVKLAAGDGTKTLYVIIRDDVLNKSSIAQATINLDTTGAVITVTNPDRPKISTVATADTAIFTFSSDQAFTEYKVCYVPTPGATHDAGVVIPTTNGSINTSGTAGNYAAATAIQVTVKGADLKLANNGDGEKYVKCFVKDNVGNWSV